MHTRALCFSEDASIPLSSTFYSEEKSGLDHSVASTESAPQLLYFSGHPRSPLWPETESISARRPCQEERALGSLLA